jgi:DNA-binding transcriptional LysR family regulator
MGSLRATLGTETYAWAIGRIGNGYGRGRTLDLAQLRYFQAIAQYGSFTAAAKALKVSQPTLTVAVKNLEEGLRTTLFHRSREGVKLTRTGQELLEHAVQVFALIDRAEERIVGLESDEVGRFVIGCHESLGAYFLPAFMRGFLEAAPGIEVSLWNGSSADVTEALVERKIDFGLVVNPRPHPDLVLVQLFHDAVDVVVAASTLPGGRALERDEAHARLREGPLVFAGRVGQATELISRLAAESLLPTRRLSCGDLELVKSLALEGVGVALLPRRVAAYGQKGKLVRLHPELPFIPDIISLVYHADLHRTRASLRLKDALIEHGKAMDAEGG